KKLILLGLLIFSCIFSNKLNAASIIQVAAPASINTIVSAAQDGDIIELTTDGGAYTWTSTAIISIEKSIIIRAASGLLTRPKVTWSGTISPTNYFIRYYPTAGSSVETWVIDGIVHLLHQI
ncbi:hypothetical protein JZU68_09875, partial [bacterium]|nr:hypothetical protein [bacterium]